MPRIKGVLQVKFSFWTCFEHSTLTLCAESVLWTFCLGPHLTRSGWLRAETSQLITVTPLSWGLLLPPLILILRGRPNLQQPSHSPEAEPCCCRGAMVQDDSKTESSPGCQLSFAFMDLVIWTLAPPQKAIVLSSLPAILPNMSLLLTRSSSKSRYTYREKEAEWAMRGSGH